MDKFGGACKFHLDETPPPSVAGGVLTHPFLHIEGSNALTDTECIVI